MYARAAVAALTVSAAACGAPEEPSAERRGAFLVEDINPGPGDSNPHVFASLDRVAVFVASTSATGSEPWVTDGTAAGTFLLRDIDGRPSGPLGGAGSSGPYFLARVGSRVFFAARDPEHGNELWVTDGTAAGTRLVKDINDDPPEQGPPFRGSSYPANITDVGGIAFFTACDEEHGPEVWRSDGTAAGTRLVADVYPGPGAVGPDSSRNVCFENDKPAFLTAIGGTLYFVANHPSYGHEVWLTDGTAEGTRLLKDTFPGPDPSPVRVVGGTPPVPRDLRDVGGRLFFVGRRGIWTSDRTEAGTVLVTSAGASPVGATRRLFFFAGADGLWRTDGTPAGTFQVGDAVLGTSPRFQNRFSQLQEAGDGLYFDAQAAESGWEPWTSDGTREGTRLVADVRPGSVGSDPQMFTTFGGTVVFTAEDGSGTRQLWMASPIGAARLTNVERGVRSESLALASRPIGTLGDLVLFPGETAAEGVELWAYRASR